MQQHFEAIINSFLEHKVGVDKTFLDETLCNHLKANLLALYANNQLKEAGIGSNARLTANKEIRSDRIFWLDRQNGNAHEAAFFDRIDAFVAYLNETCFTGITSYEFHYALYEKGTFYRRHLDQFKDNNKRAFSLITYLNDDWQREDGGQLKVYLTDKSPTVAPTKGKGVFFKSSEVEHEVLLSHKPRMSVTGWFKTN